VVVDRITFVSELVTLTAAFGASAALILYFAGDGTRGLRERRA
jgi:hypothetical protein